MRRAVLVLLALAITSAHADTVERCRTNTAGDKVCIDSGGHVVERCHTDSTGMETCRKYE